MAPIMNEITITKSASETEKKKKKKKNSDIESENKEWLKINKNPKMVAMAIQREMINFIIVID
jgi:hypothetical protein